MRLKDKVSIITGAAQGIGLATALKFAAEGAIVIICDMKPEAVDVAVAQCREAGAQATGFAVDVTDREAVDAMVAAVKAQFAANTFAQSQGQHAQYGGDRDHDDRAELIDGGRNHGLMTRDALPHMHIKLVHDQDGVVDHNAH